MKAPAVPAAGETSRSPGKWDPMESAALMGIFEACQKRARAVDEAFLAWHSVHFSRPFQSSVEGPRLFWRVVSRTMAEAGYHRSVEACKLHHALQRRTHLM